MNLKGGYKILLLSTLSLVEVETAITDNKVLEQLSTLIGYMGKKELKPILIHCGIEKDSKVTKHCVMGELKKISDTEYVIIGKIDKAYLTISVEFSQDEETEEYYIASGNATYILSETTIGYSSKFGDNTPSSPIYEPDFAGCVKTGNKLTVALAGTYTRPSEDAPINPILIEFIIPKEIYDKLVPLTSNFVSSKLLHYFDSVSSTGKDLPVSLAKRTEGSGENRIYKLQLVAYSVHSSLTAETPYIFRYEETFLLSENLLPQE